MFTVRSAYRMINGIKHQREDWLEHRPSHSNREAESKAWSQLWKVKVPSKIRVFVWRLAQMSLPTGSVRHERNMATSSACCLCDEELDSWRHSLFECRMARCVWALGDEEILEHVISNRSDDARLWLFWLFDTMNQQDLARVLITMWAIWWARRRAIHDDEFQSPMSTMCFVNRYLQDLEIATTRAPTGQTQPAQPRVHRWIPPGEDVAKINADGAISRQGRVGASAAVCRDKNGTYLGASAVVFDGLVDAPSLEAQACNEALALAQDLLLTHAIIASDCMQVVSDINGASRSSSYALVLNEIRDRITDFVKVSFRFEVREANFEAHALAKAASSLPVGRHLWLGNPPDIICIPSVVIDE